MGTTLRMVNASLLKETLAHIESHPDEWKQAAWRCKTGMCFAGWAVTLSGRQWTESSDARSVACVRAVPGDDPGRVTVEEVAAVSVPYAACKDLGLTHAQALALFDANNTLADLRELVERFIESDDAYAVAAERAQSGE